MVNFVRPDFLGTKKNFSVMFEKPIKNGQCIDSTPKDKKLSEQRIHVLTEKLKGFVHRCVGENLDFRDYSKFLGALKTF